MRRVSILPVLSLLISSSSLAAVPGPCPWRWGFDLGGNEAPCQHRFRADGGLDQLIVRITSRDCFDQPVQDCSTSATIVPTAGTLALCSCAPTRQVQFTDALGLATFEFPGDIGGRGTAEVCVTAHCLGDIAIFCREFDFTSPDLDGSCETASSATTVIDLGVWAGCLPPGPYCRASDYNCDGTVNVIDLGIWAGGLGLPCGP